MWCATISCLEERTDDSVPLQNGAFGEAERSIYSSVSALWSSTNTIRRHVNNHSRASVELSQSWAVLKLLCVRQCGGPLAQTVEQLRASVASNAKACMWSSKSKLLLPHRFSREPVSMSE